MSDDFQSPLPPLDEPRPRGNRPTPAPAWVALLAAWFGLLTLILAIVLPFLPGSKNPRAELERLEQYSLADRFIPYPIYLSAVAIFLGIVVLWQMRKEPRPLPDALLAQRIQAKVGMGLAFAGAGIVYIHVAYFGPR